MANSCIAIKPAQDASQKKPNYLRSVLMRNVRLRRAEFGVGNGIGPAEATMATGIESKAVFTERLRSLNISQAIQDAFQASGLETMASYAFGCAFQPGQPDERPLIALLAQVIGRNPSLGEASSLRRLFYESHALVITHMQSQVSRNSDDAPRKIMPAERAARHEAQQTRLGLTLQMTGEYECSHQLIDAVNSQVEENQLKHIPLERCTKRSQEMAGVKSIEAFKFNAQGFMMRSTAEEMLSSDTGNDLKVRYALVRRALAYDQCNLLAYSVQDQWINKIFHVLYKSPPLHFQQPTLVQLLHADQELFSLMAERTRANIIPVLGGGRPLDAAMIALMDHADITCLLQPLPLARSSGSNRTVDPPPPPHPDVRKDKKLKKKWWEKTEPDKGKGKGKGKEKGKSKGGLVVPPGMSAVADDGRPVCIRFNLGSCPSLHTAVGKRCMKGFHICGKCFGNHASSACTTVVE